MMFAINCRYWQAGKLSRMRMKVEGRLMQARFIKIHQVFSKGNKVGYFSNRVVYPNTLLEILSLMHLVSISVRNALTVGHEIAMY